MKELMRATAGDPLMAVVIFSGCFIFVFICCLLHYCEEKDVEKRKDCLFQWLMLDALFAVGIGLAVWML